MGARSNQELLATIEAAVLHLLQAADAECRSCTVLSVKPDDSASDAAGAPPRQSGKLVSFVTEDGPTASFRRRRALALLDSVHALLVSGRYASPRELYYTHVPLFQRQQQSDDLLKKLCAVLEVPRHHLRLVGTAKGLVRGHLRMSELLLSSAPAETTTPAYPLEDPAQSGAVCWVDGMDPLEPRGHPIAPACAHLARVVSTAHTVLVVEKETVFYRLLDEGILEKHKPLILVTGRGFPDLPTRYLLRRISEACCAPRVLLLVDFDPSGLAIAATYAFGPQDDAWIQEDLALPLALPLVCPSGTAGAMSEFGLGATDVLPLGSRDFAVARGLQRRLVRLRDTGRSIAAIWDDAVNSLLDGGVKYELDAMANLSHFVSAGLAMPL